VSTLILAIDTATPAVTGPFPRYRVRCRFVFSSRTCLVMVALASILRRRNVDMPRAFGGQS